MNKKPFLIAVPLLAAVLASCGQTFDYKDHLGEYVKEMTFHDQFNVLQLTDIHWNANTSTMASKRYLEGLLKQADLHIKAEQGPSAKIDLVELTGDQFMLSNAHHVGSFIDFFEQAAEKYGFLYASIWGNHDRHGLYNPNWLGDQFKKAAHSVYFEPEDNLYGRSNFVINLMQGNGVAWQLANLDSGASFSETALSPFRDYDYIRPDQVDWWLREHNRAGANVPAIAYYHIPQQDNGAYWNAVKGGANYKNKFFKLEGFADNGTERGKSTFIDTGRQNNLKAAFMGHAHNIDWTVDADGVVLGLGVKTGTELYYAHIDPASEDAAMKKGVEDAGVNEKFDLIGASLVTLRTGEDFELEHLYFNERAGGDFVRWVRW